MCRIVSHCFISHDECKPDQLSAFLFVRKSQVYELEKQIGDTEHERLVSRSNVEELQKQMSTMQDSHHRSRDEYERILKQLKQENELLNEQVKQHLMDPPSNARTSRKSFVPP